MKHVCLNWFTWLLLCFLISLVFAGFNINGRVFGEGESFEDDFDGNYRYAECGGLKSLIRLKELKAKPSQFEIPQIISFSIRFKILRDILPPIRIKLKISKRLPLFGYVKLPCIANYGSCIFDNACEILDKYPKNSFAYQVVCPSWFNATGIGCQCPFHTGEYRANDVPVAIESSIVPKSIATGDYKSSLILEDKHQTIGCFNFQFRLI